MSFLKQILPILLLTAGLAVAKDQPTLKNTSSSNAITAYGTIEPYGGVIGVGAENTRIVSQVMVSEGDIVSKGQVLFYQDHEKEQAQLEIQRARVGVEEAELAISEDTLKRHRDLFKQEVVSEYQVTQSQLKVNTHLAKLKVAKQELKFGEDKLAAFGVQAPVDGKVYKLAVTEGAVLKANDLDKIQMGRPRLGIRSWVVEQHAGHLPVGAEVDLFHRTTDEYLGKAVVRYQALTVQPTNPLNGQEKASDRFKLVLLELLDGDSTIPSGTLVSIRAA